MRLTLSSWPVASRTMAVPPGMGLTRVMRSALAMVLRLRRTNRRGSSRASIACSRCVTVWRSPVVVVMCSSSPSALTDATLRAGIRIVSSCRRTGMRSRYARLDAWVSTAVATRASAAARSAGAPAAWRR